MKFNPHENQSTNSIKGASDSWPIKRAALILISSVVLLIYLFNNLLPWADFQTGLWSPPYIMPYIKPVGTDFREGLYNPARLMVQGVDPWIDFNNIYPPFTTLLAVVFLPFDINTAYQIQLGLLFLLNVLSIGLAVFLAQRALTPAAQSTAERGRAQPDAIRWSLFSW